MIEGNLVDVVALLASIEATDETSALVDTRIEARHETRCEEASLLLYTRRRKKHARSSLLNRSTMNASRRH